MAGQERGEGGSKFRVKGVVISGGTMWEREVGLAGSRGDTSKKIIIIAT